MQKEQEVYTILRSFESPHIICLKMPAKKSLLIPFLFLGITVHAETKSVDYSMEPVAFPALAGWGQSSDYSEFSVAEPITGLSTVQVPDQEDSTGFLNLIRIPKLELRKAIVETLQPEISGRTVRLKARLLDDGGEAPDRLGFRVTYGSGSSSEVTEIAASRTGNLLTAQTNTFSPGKTYYVRAFAKNQAGVRFGATKAFKLDQSLPAPLGQAMSTGNGWYRSAWFGSFLPFDNGWIYHVMLGWVYPYPDGQGGLWVWLESEGWMWTQSGAFPYLWRHQSASWRYAIGLRNEIPAFLDWIEPVKSRCRFSVGERVMWYGVPVVIIKVNKGSPCTYDIDYDEDGNADLTRVSEAELDTDINGNPRSK